MELTLADLITEQKQQLTSLLNDAGGVNHLAKMLNLHYTTVKGWEDRGRISKKGAELVADHMALGEYYKAKQLRPDL